MENYADKKASGQSKTLDFAQLLGFANLAEHIDDAVDFQDETMAARLGAKVGLEKEEQTDPA